MKRIGAIFLKTGVLFSLIIICLVSFTGCGFRFLKENEILNLEDPTGKLYIKIYDETKGDEKTLVEEQVFEFVLYYKDAPNTVANFVKLVKDGYFDYDNNLTFSDLENTPFVTFGQREFYKEETFDKDDKTKLIRTDYYTKLIKPDFHIVGEFSVNGWENKRESKVGSLIMVREPFNRADYDADGKTNFDTAHAAFNILAKDSTVKYGESFCVFGQITKLPDGTTIHQSSLYPQLWTNYSYDSAYSNTNRIKYMFRIEMDNPSVNYGNPLRVKV